MRKTILAVTGLAFGFTACSSYDTSNVIEVTRKPIAVISLSLPAQPLVAGQTQRAIATPEDASGTPLTDRTITWRSSLPAIAGVDDGGVISAVAAGATVISASSEGVTGQGTLTVLAPPPISVASVTVSPSATSLPVGATIQLAAFTLDASGSVLTGRSLAWSSANANIASVTAAGLVTALSAGTTTVSVTSEGQTGSAAITVTAPAPIPVASVSVSPATSNLQIAATVQLSAVTRDAGGNVLTGRSVSWATANAGVATVSSGGLVTAIAAGTVTISANSEGRVGTATVTVAAPAPVPVASVSVSPATSNISVGGTAQLTAVTSDAGGNVLTGRAVTWASTNAGVATVSASGRVTAIAVGTATISATSEGQVGNATVTVALAAVASVTISLPKSTIVVGEAVQATATLRDANNNVLTGRTINWSSGNSAIFTVSGSGQVVGIALGTTNVVATSGGINGTASVTVAPPVVQGPAPEPGGSDVILWQDGFESGSTSGYATRGDIVPISNGHSGSALRFPYTSSSSDNLIEKVFQTSTDVYFRYWYRTSPGMDPTCGDRGGSGMKWFMAWRASGVRYTMGVGTLSEGPLGRDNRGNEFASHDNGSSDMPNPVLSDINNNIRLSTTNDGQWHKYTLHLVTSSGDGTGYEQIWIDGTLVLDDQASRYHHNAEGISMINFPGLVVDWFAGCDFTIDVDDLAVWHK